MTLVVGSLTSLNLALADIGRDTGAGQTALTWVLDAYTLTLACLLLPFGAIGDRWGRNRLLVAGSAVFAVGSLLPAAQPNIEWLLVGRVVAGMGAAMLMPATLAILTTTGRDHSRAVGIWGASAAIGGALGVFFAGVLLEFFPWTTIELATAAVAVVVMVAGTRLGLSREAVPPPVDLPGSLLAAAAIGSLTFGIMMIPEHGVRSWVVAGSWCLSAAAIAAFVGWVLNARSPILDVRIFGDRRVAGGALGLVLQFVVSYGAMYLWMLHLQIVLDLGPTLAGLALMPMVAPLLVVVAGDRLVDRFGFRWVFGVGFGAISVSCYLYAHIRPGDGYLAMLAPLVLVGLGLGLMTAPATTALVDGVPQEKQGVASAVNDSSREVGAALGIAIAGSVFTTSYRHAVTPLVGELPPALGRALAESPTAIGGLDGNAPVLRVASHAVRVAYLSGQHEASLVVGSVALLGTVVVPLVVGPSVRRSSARRDSRLDEVGHDFVNDRHQRR